MSQDLKACEHAARVMKRGAEAEMVAVVLAPCAVAVDRRAAVGTGRVGGGVGRVGAGVVA